MVCSRCPLTGKNVNPFTTLATWLLRLRARYCEMFSFELSQISGVAVNSLGICQSGVALASRHRFKIHKDPCIDQATHACLRVRNIIQDHIIPYQLGEIRTAMSWDLILQWLWLVSKSCTKQCHARGEGVAWKSFVHQQRPAIWPWDVICLVIIGQSRRMWDDSWDDWWILVLWIDSRRLTHVDST